MNEIYCFKCKTFYVKIKTGLVVSLPENENISQRGDLYRCPSCLQEVIGDFGKPYEIVYSKERRKTTNAN